MRRLKQLINDVRFNTDNLKDSRYSDIRLLKLFNDAQRALQRVMHTNDTGGKYYARDVILDAVAGQELYDLPEDIFADSAVNSISRKTSISASSNNYFTPMRMLSEKERRKEFGYALQGKKFITSPTPVTNLSSGLRVNYTYSIPLLSFRLGQISSFTDAVEIKVKGSSLFGSDDITEYADFVSVVDRDGVIKKSKIRIDSYNTSTGKITTSSSLVAGERFTGGPSEAGVAVGDYVVLGKVATSHSELPEICEQILTDLVGRKIHAIDSSQETSIADLITKDEETAIMNLFKDAEQDVKYPPISDDTYLNF